MSRFLLQVKEFAKCNVLDVAGDSSHFFAITNESFNNLYHSDGETGWKAYDFPIFHRVDRIAASGQFLMGAKGRDELVFWHLGKDGKAVTWKTSTPNQGKIVDMDACGECFCVLVEETEAPLGGASPRRQE